MEASPNPPTSPYRLEALDPEHRYHDVEEKEGHQPEAPDRDPTGQGGDPSDGLGRGLVRGRVDRADGRREWGSPDGGTHGIPCGGNAYVSPSPVNVATTVPPDGSHPEEK